MLDIIRLICKYFAILYSVTITVSFLILFACLNHSYPLPPIYNPIIPFNLITQPTINLYMQLTANPTLNNTTFKTTPIANDPNDPQHALHSSHWVATHIDGKFYLTTEEAYRRLQGLEQQIAEERGRLGGMTAGEGRDEGRVEGGLGQAVRGGVAGRGRKNSVGSEVSRQCKTEVDGLKAMKTGVQAQQQQTGYEIKYLNKTIEAKKRRQLVQDKRNEAVQRKQRTASRQSHDKSMSTQNKFRDTASRKNEDRNNRPFMMTPDQLSGNTIYNIPAFMSQQNKKKTTRKIEQNHDQKISQPSVIENKVGRKDQSKVDKESKRYSSASKEKYFQVSTKRYKISSRKQYSQVGSRSRDQMVGDSRSLQSRQQIARLSKKLQQMQKKLHDVQKKQKMIDFTEKNKQKSISQQQDLKNSSGTNKFSHSQSISQPQRKLNSHNTINSIQNDIKSAKKYKDRVQNSLGKQSHILIQTHQQEPGPLKFFETRQTKKNVVKLGINSSTIMFNYNQEKIQKQMQYLEQNQKKIMESKIKELTDRIRKLTIEKIKQEVIIKDLEYYKIYKEQNQQSKTKQQMIETNQRTVQHYAQSVHNSRLMKHRDSLSDQNSMTMNAYQSVQYAQQEAPDVPRPKQSSIKKQPRRILRISSHKKKPFLNEQEQINANIIIAPKCNTFVLTSTQIQQHLETLRQNPEQKQPINSQSSEVDLFNSGSKPKGIIVKQIINSSKFQKTSQKNDREESMKNPTQKQPSQKSRKMSAASGTKQAFQQDYILQEELTLTQEQVKKPQFIFPEFNPPQPSPIPQLPDPPFIQSNLTDIYKSIQTICASFNIPLQAKQYFQLRKLKNCFILRNQAQQTAIVWHFSGKFYIGGWIEDSTTGEQYKNGEGLECVPGKYYYQGQYVSGRRQGQGTMFQQNGNVYQGQWHAGEKHGFGVYYQRDLGVLYEGQWSGGRRNGKGMLRRSEKEVYQGQFERGAKNGEGKQIFMNGDCYQGQYKNGKFHGYGRYFWSNGSVYVGNFVQGLRQGLGKWKSSLSSESDFYTGEYKNDKKEGKGKYIWANKCVYEGFFKNDLREGEGVVEYPDDRKVQGIWVAGRLKQATQISPPRGYSQQDQHNPDEMTKNPQIAESPSRSMQESRNLERV